MSISARFNLFEAITKYAELKEQADSLKKDIDKYSANIKAEFTRRNITEFTAGGIRATVTPQTKVEVNEEHALEILKEKLKDKPDLLNSIIKTKEYIDEAEFEKAVYHNEIDAAILAPATTTKEILVLRLGKAKL